MPNTNEDVVFRRGPSSTIPADKVPGTVLVETDTGNMYVDDTSSSRVQIKDDTKLPLSGGTMTGDLSMGSKTLVFSGEGNYTDFKMYYDTEYGEFYLGGPNPGSSISIAGVSLPDNFGSGCQLSCVATPTSDFQAANKKYVDSVAGNPSIDDGSLT